MRKALSILLLTCFAYIGDAQHIFITGKLQKPVGNVGANSFHSYIVKNANVAGGAGFYLVVGTDTTKFEFTGGNYSMNRSINLEDGAVFKAQNGGGQLNLREGADNIFSLTNDNASYGKAWFYGDDNVTQLGYAGSYIDFNNQIGGSVVSLFNSAHIGIQFAPNSGVGRTVSYTESAGTTAGLFLNTNNSTTNSSISKTVILGGQQITAKTSGVAYANRVSLQPQGNTFDGLLTPPTLTADRTWTYPDATGTVALTSDILNIYNSDGTLTGTRTVNGNFNDVLWDDFNAYTLQVDDTYEIQSTAGTPYFSVSASQIDARENLAVTPGKVIKTTSGGGQLNLRNGADGVVDLSTDNGAFVTPALRLNAAVPITALSLNATEGVSITNAVSTIAHGTAIHLKVGGGFNFLGTGILSQISSTTEAKIILDDGVSYAPVAFQAEKNTAGPVLGDMNTDAVATFINNDNTTFNVNVANSAAVTGTGMTVKSNNTLYSNKISLQPSGNTFDGLLTPPTLTADRTWTYPDATGTVAITSDITLANALANANITGGNSIRISTTDQITVIDGTPTPNVIEHEVYSGSYLSMTGGVSGGQVGLFGANQLETGITSAKWTHTSGTIRASANTWFSTHQVSWGNSQQHTIEEVGGNMVFASTTGFRFEDANTTQQKTGTAISTATQSESRQTRYEVSLWDGGAETVESWGIRGKGSTTVDRRSFMDFDSNGGVVLRLTNNNQMALGNTTFDTENGDKWLLIGTGNAPSSSETDAFIQYSADVVAGNAAPHFRTEVGDVIKLFSDGGWSAVTGTATKGGWDTTTGNLGDVKETVKAMYDAMVANGLIKP